MPTLCSASAFASAPCPPFVDVVVFAIPPDDNEPTISLSSSAPDQHSPRLRVFLMDFEHHLSTCERENERERERKAKLLLLLLSSGLRRRKRGRGRGEERRGEQERGGTDTQQRKREDNAAREARERDIDQHLYIHTFAQSVSRRRGGLSSWEPPPLRNLKSTSMASTRKLLLACVVAVVMLCSGATVVSAGKRINNRIDRGNFHGQEGVRQIAHIGTH